MSIDELNNKYNNLVKSKDILNAEVSKTYESSLICSNDRPSFNNLQSLIKRFERLETYVNDAKINSDSLDYTAITGKLETLTKSINSDISQLNNFLISLTSSSSDAFNELLTEYNECFKTFERYQSAYISFKNLYLFTQTLLKDPNITDLEKEFNINRSSGYLTSMGQCITGMQTSLNKMQELSDAGLKLERVVSNANSATTYTGGKFQTIYVDQPY